MTIADVLAAIAGLAVLGAGFPALLSVVHLLLPTTAARSAAVIAATPVRAVLAGAGSALAIVVAASTASALLAGPGRLLGVLAVIGGLAVAAVGAAGLAGHLAHAARSEAGSRGVADVAAAAVALELACALPVLGWFVVLPLAFLVSLGASTLALLAHGARRPLAARAAVGLDSHA